ncbi:MAG: 16S rRNA (cytidine(1402)-2'-O)-methyltransferase [Candidatus Omnitrophota bacterium]|jgi:16S rRNA (cytidine1402-2'-O)-methyltransferase
MLYIVGTPIGNLKDISFRAVEILKGVDLIACEDTRHARILLSAYDIRVPVTSFFQHNRLTKAEFLLEKLRAGLSIALISDAGMPGILDPGYNIINLAIENKIPMSVIPGPTALATALVASGKPAHRFLFEGFLPNRRQARKKRLAELSVFDFTVVCYESCHRIKESLEDIAEIFGERRICCARELTKKFEEVKHGSAAEVAASFPAAGRPRGEFVLIF